MLTAANGDYIRNHRKATAYAKSDATRKLPKKLEQQALSLLNIKSISLSSCKPTTFGGLATKYIAVLSYGTEQIQKYPLNNGTTVANKGLQTLRTSLLQ